MVPDANVSEQLDIAHETIQVWEDYNEDGALTIRQAVRVAEQANRLAELVIELDEWIQKGGPLPSRWGPKEV